jgi:hypothetical protein
MEKGNWVELFNEFCILLCSYVMNVFLAKAAPPDFMFKTGWVFMGISIFNIVINFAAMIVGMIHENGIKVRNNRKQKKLMKAIDLRLENMRKIKELKPENMGYIETEIQT